MCLLLVTGETESIELVVSIEAVSAWLNEPNKKLRQISIEKKNNDSFEIQAKDTSQFEKKCQKSSPRNII